MNPALFGSAQHHRIPLVPRAPLPPFPEPVNYHHVLPFVPPAFPTLEFYRGQFCGLRVADAPVVPGSNPANPSCIMAALLDNYPRKMQDQFLLQYAEDGNTHLQRSIGHALYYGSSLQQIIDLSRHAQQDYGLYCDVWYLGVVEWQQRNMPAEYWIPWLDAMIQPMLDAGVIDTSCVGWQLDNFMYDSPGNKTIGLIAAVADRLPKEIPVFTHWVNEALGWWKTGGEVWTYPDGRTINVVDRFTWWQAMAPYLTGGNYQGDGGISLKDPKLYQDRICDTLDPFGGDRSKGYMGQSIRTGAAQNYRLNAFESTGQNQFDDRCSEIDGDLSGFLQMCTVGYGGIALSGYGNGARLVDGWAL